MQIPEKWTFQNKSVADHFDEHVREQLPWYDMVTRGVAHYAEHYLQPGTTVVDVGASTGNIERCLAPLLERRKAHVIPIEPAQEMIDKYVGFGRHFMISENVEDVDFSKLQKVSLITCMLSLMFVSPRHRQKVVDEMVSCLVPGGAIIVVDKVGNTGGEFGSATMRLTMREKQIAGASMDQIAIKELSLAGVQRPLPRAWLEGNFGAHKWFQFGDFAGWIIERGMKSPEDAD